MIFSCHQFQFIIYKIIYIIHIIFINIKYNNNNFLFLNFISDLKSSKNLNSFIFFFFNELNLLQNKVIIYNYYIKFTFLFKAHLVLIINNILNVFKFLQLSEHVIKHSYWICKIEDTLYKHQFKFDHESRKKQIKAKTQYYYSVFLLISSFY